MEENQNQLTKNERWQARQEEKNSEEAKRAMQKRMKKISKIIFWIIGVSGIIWYIIAHPPEARTNREVALACTTDMATQFHIHPYLEIMINGAPYEMPTDIGIHPTCMNALHTHDASGVIHVEAPDKRDFTLADFFAVWGKTFNKDQIIDYKIDNKYRIRETINDKNSQDFENTILRDEDKIIIYYENY